MVRRKYLIQNKSKKKLTEANSSVRSLFASNLTPLTTAYMPKNVKKAQSINLAIKRTEAGFNFHKMIAAIVR